MINTFQIIAGEEHHKTRLDIFIADSLPDLSRSFVQKLIASGNVSRNKIPCTKHGEKVISGDMITVILPETEKWDMQAENLPLDVVYEDDDLLVVNKTAGMPVHPGAGHRSGTLVNALMHHCGDHLSAINGFERPGIVHRLDKDTSGLLVVAKSDAVHNKLSEQFAEKTARRKYRALVWLSPAEPSGRIETMINRDNKDRKKMAVRKTGKSAVTNFETLEPFSFCTYLELALETGRTHQIRVHMKHSGTPVVGDETYGGGKLFLNRLPVMERKFAGDILKAIPYFLLHAKELAFFHPVKQETMTFTSDLPDYFSQTLDKLRAREKKIG